MGRTHDTTGQVRITDRLRREPNEPVPPHPCGDWVLTPQVIARILGAHADVVEAHWALIKQALATEGIGTPLVEVAALATIGTELPSFSPRQELSPRDEDRTAYFVRMYYTNQKVRHALGNLSPDDAAKYCGRGFLQITGRDNYQVFGDLLGIDLINQPDLALQPEVAARIFAAYFRRRQVAQAAEAQDWLRVRVRVNGGSNGWERFSALVASLQAADQ